MLRMQNILFDENGCVKLQEMSHVHFDEFDIKESDLSFLPPDVLKGGSVSTAGSQNNRRGKNNMAANGQQNIFQLNSSMDVWTLGMILLHCMCLEDKKSEYDQDTFQEILNLQMKI